MAIQKKQHQIPRFYMKNFARSNNKFSAIITKEGEEILYLEEIPYKDQCYENFYYGKDLIWENKLKEVEDKAAVIIEKIVEEDYSLLTDDEVDNLRLFIFIQYSRVPNYVNSTLYKKAYQMKEYSNMYLRNRTFEGLKSVTIQDTLLYMHQNMKREIIDLVLNMSMNNSQRCGDLAYLIIDFDTNEDLIFSDNPAFIYNQFLKKNGGCGVAGVMLMLPISPKVLLLFYDSKIYPEFKNQTRIKISNELDVIKLNEIQIILRGEKIFYSDITMTSRLLYRINRLMKDRLNYIKSFQPSVFGTNNDRVIISSTGVINKDIEFSFCLMHERIKKLKFIDSYMLRNYEQGYFERLDSLQCNRRNEEKEAIKEYKKFVNDYWLDAFY